MTVIPIVRNSNDYTLAHLYFKDVVRCLHADPEAAEHTAERAVRPATFVPESKPVDDLLRQMQHEANHVAIVVDEYGGTAGIDRKSTRLNSSHVPTSYAVFCLTKKTMIITPIPR